MTMRKRNQLVAADRRLDAVMRSVRDGITVARQTSVHARAQAGHPFGAA